MHVTERDERANPLLTLNKQIAFDVAAGSAVDRELTNGRQRLLRADDSTDGLIDRREIGRHFVTNFVGKASTFEDIRGVMPHRDVFNNRFALQLRLDDLSEVVDFRQQIMFEVIDQLFGELFGVRELLTQRLLGNRSLRHRFAPGYKGFDPQPSKLDPLRTRTVKVLVLPVGNLPEMS